MDWTPEMDRKLKAAVAAGQTRRGWAREMGISESAAIARYNRLMGIIFPYDAAQRKLAREQAAEKLRKKLASEARALAAMDKQIKRGVPRRQAMIDAYVAGASYRALGKHFGVSWQAAQQYVTYYGSAKRLKAA